VRLSAALRRRIPVSLHFPRQSVPAPGEMFIPIVALFEKEDSLPDGTPGIHGLFPRRFPGAMDGPGRLCLSPLNPRPPLQCRRPVQNRPSTAIFDRAPPQLRSPPVSILTDGAHPIPSLPRHGPRAWVTRRYLVSGHGKSESVSPLGEVHSQCVWGHMETMCDEIGYASCQIPEDRKQWPKFPQNRSHGKPCYHVNSPALLFPMAFPSQ
jgi:hypothetical protein